MMKLFNPRLGSVLAAIALSALVFLGLPSPAQADLTIVNNGKSDYSIVCDTAPPKTYAALRGARELQSYIARMTGATLPILSSASPLPAHAIIVGPNRATRELGIHLRKRNLGDDGFVLKTVGDRLVIAGPGRRGSMYGCFTLLDKLGVRWFTAKVTLIPHEATLTIPDLDETQIPSFEYREPYFTEALDPDWASHNLLNGNFSPLDAGYGGRIQYGQYFVHTFNELVPEDLYKTHPEYFPLINGKRVNGYVQRCLSNPEVLKLAIGKVEQWIKDDPDAKIYSVSQNDTGNWCQCDQCKAIMAKYGGVTGEYIWFVNQVAAAIAKDHPDKLIDTLAYQFTEAPPSNIKPLPNVRVRLCPIACEDAHPYTESNYPANKALVERLKQWHAITDDLYIWHYSTDFANYLMPFADFAQFPDTIRLYKNNGVKGIFFEGDYAPGGGGSDAELRSYVLARLLWNCNDDARARVVEWMNGVYGPAAKPMLAWHDLIQAQYKDPNQHLMIYDQPKPEIFTPAVMEKGKELFAQAEQLAATPLQREYIEKANLDWRYVDLKLHPDTGEKLDQFIADAKAFGIKQFNEGRPINQWVEAYRKEHAPKK